jgi:regulator of sirC expression with transglutaminase-like and TPR domain
MPEKNITKELTALMQLLDEPDEQVYEAIRSRILAMGVGTLPLLEVEENNARTPKEKTRIEEIIHTIKVEDVFGKLKFWALHKSHDLLEAWILISGFLSPEDDNEQLKTSVNKIYRDIWVEMNNQLTALEKIRVINHVFYNVYQFDALQGDKPLLTPYLLGNVLRMHKGNPLSMALLYLIIVQRLNIPMFGVNLPKHLILAFTNGKTILKPATGYDEEDVLFYLNPYNKGAVFRKSEIELFIRQLKIKEQESFYLPCENKVIIRRLLQELELLHKRNHNLIMAETIQYFLKAVS